MSKLIPVIYHKIKYPSPIKANICEIAGNFDREDIVVNTPYSLHTEYSYGERTFSSNIFHDLKHITLAQKNNIPQLWYNKEWADNFLLFIGRLIDSNKNKPPEVLEIHPPFNDYCSSFVQFLDIFLVFYNKFIKKYPKTTILIENRYGTKNKGGEFLLSTCSDILNFCDFLSKSNIKLKIVLDYPQLFSAEVANIKKDKKRMDTNSIDNNKKEENWMGPNPLQLVEKIISFNLKLRKYREIVGGFHMWGKLKTGNRWTPHAGNFDTFFSNDKKLKHDFLSSVFSTFNDSIARYFVPEVNSGESDLHSLVNDMEKEGFIFLSKKRCMSEEKKKVFNGCFRWPGIKIPENNLDYRESGFFEKNGWLIQFCFGEKDGNVLPTLNLEF